MGVTRIPASISPHLVFINLKFGPRPIPSRRESVITIHKPYFHLYLTQKGQVFYDWDTIRENAKKFALSIT